MSISSAAAITATVVYNINLVLSNSTLINNRYIYLDVAPDCHVL